MSRRAERYKIVDRGLVHFVSATKFVEYLTAGYIERSVNNRHIGIVLKWFRTKLSAAGQLIFTQHAPKPDYNDPEVRQNCGPKLLKAAIYQAPISCWTVHVKGVEDFKSTAPVSFICQSQAHDVAIVRVGRKVAEVWNRGQLEAQVA